MNTKDQAATGEIKVGDRVVKTGRTPSNRVGIEPRKGPRT